MAVLNTPNQTKELDSALDYVKDVVKSIADEKGVELSTNQIDQYVSLVISNNFQFCAEELWSEIIKELFVISTQTEA